MSKTINNYVGDDFKGSAVAGDYVSNPAEHLGEGFYGSLNTATDYFTLVEYV